ncbi:MAG: aldehyde dehydrogenase family protein [Thaumarchaeota archaeon]|nr:aldehyde dehydrogenase family protein [Nitrososphaerota archaeon]
MVRYRMETGMKVKGKLEIQLNSFFEPIYDNVHDVPVFKLLIDGKWRSAENHETFEVKSPIDLSTVARAQMASPEDVKSAIDAADKNQNKIRDIPGIGRVEMFRKAADILSQHMEEFINTLMLESGKIREDAEGEVQATIDRMKLTMEEARSIFGEYIPGDWSEDTTQKMALVIRQPVGIVAAISPFNYPLFIGSAKIIPSLLAGNAVVAKCASADPLVMLMYGRVLEEAGLPKGVLNIVTGTGDDIGSALVSDERVGAINFTGSTGVGKFIAQHAGIKKLHLELGGKGMAIVLDDANLDLAANKCVAGSLKNAGQRCDAISAVLVQENVADEFVDKVDKEMDKWVGGDPRNKDTRVGPLISQRAAEWVHSLVQDAIDKGADLRKGGNFKDCYHEPTLLDKVPQSARIAWEETFGPVVTVMRVKDENEAIDIGSKSRYGLDSCIFTESFYRMWKISKQLKVGGITINDLPKHGVGFFPFGGSKESGIGREGIGFSIDEMTYLKTIVFNLEPAGLGKAKRRYL